jgi:hypothetical protein
MQHKAAINRARPGPAQARARRTASGHLAALRASRRRADVARAPGAGGGEAARAARAAAKEDVRAAWRARCGALRLSAPP